MKLNLDFSNSFPLNEFLRELEEMLIEDVMRRFGQNTTQSAAFLQINRTTLVEKRRKLGMKMGGPCGRKRK